MNEILRKFEHVAAVFEILGNNHVKCETVYKKYRYIYTVKCNFRVKESLKRNPQGVIECRPTSGTFFFFDWITFSFAVCSLKFIYSFI